MAYDSTQPTDTTKIRNGPSVIRANWLAIANGDSSFKPIALNMPNRTTSTVPITPTTIADTNILYVKEDPLNSNPELFMMNSGGKDLQLSTSSDANDATFGANPGWTFLPGGLIMQYDSIASPAATGTETFPFTFPNAVFQILISVESTVSLKTVSIHTFTTSQFEWISNSVASVTNYHWMAIGN